MNTSRASLLCSLLLVYGAAAHAQETAPVAAPDSVRAVERYAPPASVPDSVLAVAKDRVAVLTLRDGNEVIGTPAAFDAATVTFVEAASGRVVALARADVISLRLRSAYYAAAPTPTSTPTPAPTLPAPPATKRHVGIQLYQGPGNVMLDLDYGHFYGFLGTSIGYPVIFSGSFDTASSGDKQYVGFVLGLGGTWKLSARSAWQFDLSGTLTPTWWGGFSAGIGLSAGFHYTSPSGFTVGFKIPVFGVAPGCSDVFGSSSSDGFGNSTGSCKTVSGGSALVGNYYLQAGMSLPILSIGYRF